MKSPRLVVEFFYDVISPYSFFAFELLCRYRGKWDIDLKFMPFLLGKVMKETGNQPPAMVAQRGAYMLQDVARLNEYYQVPLEIPKYDLLCLVASILDREHKMNNFFDLIGKGSLPVQRFITAVDMKYPQHTEELSRKFWMRLFHTHEDVLEIESMKEAAKQSGLSDSTVKDALDRLSHQDTKDRLKYCTNKALEYGAFGAPTIVAHINNKPEIFFGSDRMELMAHMMGKPWVGPHPSGKL